MNKELSWSAMSLQFPAITLFTMSLAPSSEFDLHLETPLPFLLDNSQTVYCYTLFRIVKYLLIKQFMLA